MEPRIYGVETEYALAVETAERRLLACDPSKVFDALESRLLERYATLEADSFGRTPDAQRDGIAIREGRFVENGARFYYDTGHLEWATPECAAARQAALYELAGESCLAGLARELALPQDGRLLLLKNNVDYSRGATFGCHENYLVRRGRGASERVLFARLVELLVPFLVTRQIFAGAGKLGSSRDRQAVGYQISQRADFVECVTSRETRSQRAIVNERDESLGDRSRFRRLHLILGDSNRSACASVLKLGTTGLVLELIENDALSRVPVLADPVAAIKSVSRDLSCRRPLPLRDGGRLGPIGVQYRYLACAERYFRRRDDGEAHAILDLWQRVLDDLESDPARVADRVDWMIKREHLLEPRLREARTSWEEVAAWTRLLGELDRDAERLGLARSAPARPSMPSAGQRARCQFFVDAHGLRWQDYGAQRHLFFDLRERDLRYHDIDPARGLFSLLERAGLVAGVFSPEEVARAAAEPPGDTRARQRAEVIRWARRTAQLDTLVDWGRVSFRQPPATVALDDPFRSCHPEVRSLLSGRAPAAEDGEFEIRILEESPAQGRLRPAAAAARWLKGLLGD